MSWNRKGILVCSIAVICLAAVLAGRAFLSGTEQQPNYASEEDLMASVTGDAVATVLPQGKSTPTSVGRENERERNQKARVQKNVPSSQPSSTVSSGKKQEKRDGKKKEQKASLKKKTTKKTETKMKNAYMAVTPAPTKQIPERACIALEIQCYAIMKKPDLWRDGLEDVIPNQGLFYRGEPEITEGETVYDVLKRVCKEKGLLLDTEYTPIYGTYYIKGIGNLYEFDCGSESGWKYKVNDRMAGVGCSNYPVKNGDRVEFFFDYEY